MARVDILGYEKMKKNQQKVVEEASLVALTTELAFLLAIPVIVLAIMGHLIDQSTGGGFFFLIIGTILGILVATILAVRKVTAVIRRADENYNLAQEQKKQEKQ